MTSRTPSDSFLLERQDRLQAEGAALVRELGLLESLSRVGPAKQIGSSVMGLMVWRDLDFVVHSPKLPASEALASLLPLVAGPGILEARYSNEQGERSPGGDPRDSRHYLVAHYRAPSGETWKLDITFWTSGFQHDHEGYTRAITARLTDETRLTILRLKDAWHGKPVYPYQVGGHEVYDAVLNHGARTEGNFRAYLRERGLPDD